MPTRFSLEQMSIASPCRYDWDAMAGDDRVRHCAGCDRNVYDLSGMTRTEAEDLVHQAEGRLCVRFFRRQDGTVLTADCPVGVRVFRRWVFGMIGVAATLFFAMVGFGGYLLARTFSSRGPVAWQRPIVPGIVNPPPQVVMGEMCPPMPPVALPEAPPPVPLPEIPPPREALPELPPEPVGRR